MVLKILIVWSSNIYYRTSHYISSNISSRAIFHTGFLLKVLVCYQILIPIFDLLYNKCITHHLLIQTCRKAVLASLYFNFFKHGSVLCSLHVSFSFNSNTGSLEKFLVLSDNIEYGKSL